MKVTDILQEIELIAPPAYQESYDNCGIQVGDPAAEVKGVLVSLDVTEAVVAEAMERGCNLIITHHPLLFGGLKSITGKTYVERTVLAALRNDITIYSAHTSIDNMKDGVNAVIAARLGLTDTQILQPKTGTLSKLYTYCPIDTAPAVRDALFAAGARTVDDGMKGKNPQTHPGISARGIEHLVGRAGRAAVG
jgi:dinuclear metal center YbgI/SA1388 family protein